MMNIKDERSCGVLLLAQLVLLPAAVAAAAACGCCPIAKHTFFTMYVQLHFTVQLHFDFLLLWCCSCRSSCCLGLMTSWAESQGQPAAAAAAVVRMLPHGLSRVVALVTLVAKSRVL
jgi:hypothetical protein